MAIIGAVALVGACGLNPQPIPPGDTDGTSQGGDAGSPTAVTGGGGADASNKDDDSGLLVPDDGGADAADASDDAADSGDT